MMTTMKETEHTHPHRHMSARQRMVLTAAGVIMLMGMLVAIWVGLARAGAVQQGLTQAQVSIAQISTENNQILQAVEECTTEGGPCYEAQQVRTSVVINSLRHTIIYANWCSANNPSASVEELEACVERLLLANDTNESR